MTRASGPMVCMTCRRVLDYSPVLDRWVHVAELVGKADHETVAVPADELTTIDVRCDFCTSDEPRWTFECTPFEHEMGNDDGAWAACDGCCDDVVNGRWGQLAEKSLASFEKVEGPGDPVMREMLLRLLLDLHRTFDRNRTGEPKRS